MASHKTLKSVATSLAQAFTSLMNYRADDYVMGHVVYAAWSTRATDLELDLLSGVAAPSALLVAPVRDSLASYVRWFPDLVRRSNSTLQFVKEARLSVTVDPTTRRPHGGSRFFESPFTCTVRIVDDRGKVYSHMIADWWYPERTPPALG